MADTLAMAVRVFDTPLGRIGVAATSRGLARTWLPSAVAGAESEAPGDGGRTARAYAQRAEREIRQYLAGRRRRFTVPLDLAAEPPFRRKVLEAARQIPYGRTETYGGLARRAGRPRAARAVGQAMAHNPLALLVPCHRVVATGGGLGGFGGGLALKKRLLALEGG